MNKRTIVLAISTLTILGFTAAAVRYKGISVPLEAPAVAKAANALVRFNSPTLGPINAPVTIVEFFDPSCESCQALLDPRRVHRFASLLDIQTNRLRHLPRHQGFRIIMPLRLSIQDGLQYRRINPL
ncbi:MAG: hypothetical protein WA173_19000 [Pseudomonas sp.]|uniref:hypothetical protein n=1 Tax=Pseudomonas sp. TaxID=306 RepID=UPI003BB5E962